MHTYGPPWSNSKQFFNSININSIKLIPHARCLDQSLFVLSSENAYYLFVLSSSLSGFERIPPPFLFFASSSSSLPNKPCLCSFPHDRPISPVCPSVCPSHPSLALDSRSRVPLVYIYGVLVMKSAGHLHQPDSSGECLCVCAHVCLCVCVFLCDLVCWHGRTFNIIEFHVPAQPCLSTSNSLLFIVCANRFRILMLSIAILMIMDCYRGWLSYVAPESVHRTVPELRFLSLFL